MKVLSIALAVLAMIAGLLAAYYWFKASKPPVVDEAFTRSGDPAFTRMGETSTLLVAGYESARLNGAGARWAAVAAVLGGVSTLVGSLA